MSCCGLVVLLTRTTGRPAMHRRAMGTAPHDGNLPGLPATDTSARDRQLGVDRRDCARERSGGFRGVPVRGLNPVNSFAFLTVCVE